MDQTTTTTTTAADDAAPTNIVKGKRTKRQRLQSSIPFTLVTQSSTSNNSSSPASSSDFPTTTTTTEDEDTANCLILLSKGHNLSPINNHQFSSYKFNSKKYIQTSTHVADGLTGIYVYECKTCSRTFPSFQALGGHRASHKKPRINERPPPPPYTAFSDEDDQLSPQFEFPSRKNNSSSSSSLSLQLNHRVSSTKKSSSKLHECSICGTEFNSGQALGGHMRRHRVANGTTTSSATTLSLIPYTPVTPMVADDQDYQKSRMNDGFCLDLDLNLPAPPEAADASSNQDHQHRESSFTFTANQNKQQSAVHLSAAPTLVDCHY